MFAVTISKEEYAALVKLRQEVILRTFRQSFARQLLECVEAVEEPHWPRVVREAFRFAQQDDFEGADLFINRKPL